MVNKSDFNRSLSRIFSNPVFKSIALSGNSDYLLAKLKKYDSVLSIDSSMRVKQIIENAYGYLSKNYRNEYLYKNTILNNVLLGRHSIRTATMLNELKISGSIADTVIINGTSTAYEIKTELDSPEKLNKQISDYKKGFSKVYIVTHHSLSEKYHTLLKNTSVGILSLSGRFNLTEVKNSEEDTTDLCSDTMMRMLRKDEYLSIVKGITGELPKVSNINLFSECLKVSKEIKPEDLQKMVIKQLKKRTLKEAHFLESNELPRELKHICLCINPDKQGYNNLLTFLNHNL